MTTLTTFTCFPELPPELREMIWIEAFTASPCVWYANKNCVYRYEEEEGKARDPFFTRISESPPECRAGFTNRESWSLLHKVCDKSHCIADHPPLSGVYWADFGKTLFHLDNWETGIFTLMALEKTFLERIEHVGLEWRMRPQMGEVCQFLAAHCPRLKTITLQKRDWQLSYCHDPLLGSDPTAFCEWILGYEGPEITHDVKDKSELRDELMYYWEGSGRDRPKMHLVSSCSPNFNFIPHPTAGKLFLKPFHE